jgi:hypothetical protein
MDEYSALAQRVAMTMDDVRGCLVLSRDGMVLGAFPEESEQTLKPAWLRFVNVGDARRSFVEFGDQIWAYIFRGPYAAFVVSGTSVRPGVLLDQLEMALLTAEEARHKRETLRVPEAPGAPTGKPRTPLHPPATDRPPAEVLSGAPPIDAGAAAAVTEPPAGVVPEAGDEPEPLRDSPFARVRAERSELPIQGGGGSDPVLDAAADPVAPEPGAAAEPSPGSSFPRGPQRLAGEGDAPAPEAGEIDRVMLAKEFGGLLQADSEADEASS